MSSEHTVGSSIIQLQDTYVVVTFKVSRATDVDESCVPTTELGTSLWMGILAASAVEAKLAITTVNGIERTCIIESDSASANLSECGRLQLLGSER